MRAHYCGCVIHGVGGCGEAIFIRLTVGENGFTQFTTGKPNLLINNGSVCGVRNNKPIWLCSCCNDARFGGFASQRERMTCAFMSEMHEHTWAWPKINRNSLDLCSCASLFPWQVECKHYCLCKELASSTVLKKIETGLESGLKHLQMLKQLHN